MDVTGEKLKNNNSNKYKDYELIIFEEIYTLNSNLLMKLYNFMKKSENKLIIANGDVRQLSSIDEKLTDLKITELINFMFPNHVYLKISKRFKLDERFNELKALLLEFEGKFNEKDCINYIVNHIFKNQQIKNIEDIDSLNNISYTNTTRNLINDVVHKKIIKKNKKGYYYAGLTLICKSRMKINNNIFNVNQRYKINKVEKDAIFIKINDDIVELSKEIIMKKFTLPYCYTCHSAQGVTIENKYVIFDYDNYYVNLKWLYVAITRCTNLNNVYFYIGNLNKKEQENKEKINNMIINYKEQDKKANREINDKKYIDCEWVLTQMKKQYSSCSYCHNIIEIDSLNDNEKLSIDRIKNEFAHNKNNCVLSCLHCNVSKK